MTFRKTASNLLASATNAIDMLFGKSKPALAQNPSTQTDTPLEPENAIPGMFFSANDIEVLTGERPKEEAIAYFMARSTDGLLSVRSCGSIFYPTINVQTCGVSNGQARSNEPISFPLSCSNHCCSTAHPDH